MMHGQANIRCVGQATCVRERKIHMGFDGKVYKKETTWKTRCRDNTKIDVGEVR